MLIKSDTQTLFTRWIIYFVAALLIFSTNYLGWSDSIRRPTESVTVPVKQFIWQQTGIATDQFRWLTFWYQSDQELQKLRRSYQEQSTLIAKIGELESENKNLRKLMGADFPAGWKFQPAKVLGRNQANLFINLGSNHGLQSGMMVILPPVGDSNNGVLVGKISRSLPGQSEITTIIAPNTRIPILVRNQKNARQTAEGLLSIENGELLVSKLLPEEKIQSGDLVITKGEISGSDEELTTNWLPDIPIGIVSEVKFEPENDLYQQAKVTWLAEGETLEEVFVVTSW